MRRLASVTLALLLVPAAATAAPCGADRCHLFRAAAGANGAIAAGPDGALWFAGPGFLGRLGPDGKVIRMAAPVTPQSAVAAGSDGAIWFAAQDGSVGRRDPAGTFSYRSVGAPAANPPALALGPDGAMWFASGQSAGRIGFDGHISRYSLTTFVTGPQSLITGPDGALWMNAGGGLVRLSTTGEARLFPLVTTPFGPLAFRSVGRIAAGPDGGIWATVPNAQRVVRFSPRTGRMTVFRTSQRPFHLVAGPSHSLWFTMTAPGRRLSVVRMEPSGFKSYFQVRGPVHGMAVGANDGIYMTKGNGIERLTPFLGAHLIRSRVVLVNLFAGSASVRLLCPKFDHVLCAGTITLRYRGRVLSVTPFSQRVNDAPATRLLLNALGRRLVRARARVRVFMTIVQHDQGGTARRTTQAVFLRRR